MQDEAEITISGVKLTDAESMTVRVANDTLANVLAEGLEEKESGALIDLYMSSLIGNIASSRVGAAKSR